jgi:hypothetical protein
MDSLNHRVGRVLSFSRVVGIGTPPTSSEGECAPPLVPGGGAHSLAREGVGESQFRRGGCLTYAGGHSDTGPLEPLMCVAWVRVP